MKKRLPKIADWPAFLEAWGVKAKEPRRKGAPKVVSTFAGCGGSSTGYRMAGFDIVLATDWWDVAGRTYRKNWPDCRYLVADIMKMDGRDVLKEIGLDVGELDLLDGSPPCQGFSTAGKRILDDPRNSLFLDFCRLLEAMKPKVFIMENVSGLVRGKMRIIFREMTSELKSKGYDVSCRMLNASWLGVPQARKRMIWVGIRNDLEISPTYPTPAYMRPSVMDTIGSLLVGEGENKVFIKAVGGGYMNNIRWNAEAPRAAALPTSAPTLEQWKRKSHFVGSHNAKRLEGDKPSPVVIGAVRHWSPLEPRQLTDRELARLQSFPDWYEFIGNKSEVQRQIGNAVPPLMAAHVALAMSEKLFGFPAIYVDFDISDNGGKP